MVPVLFLFCLRMAFMKADLFCEEVVDLGAPANLTCNIMPVSNVHVYSTPRGHAASCDLSDGKCITLGDFSASVINTTCSVLSIPSVRQSHDGKWTCNVDQANHDTCHMTVAKAPSCNITSDQNSSGLSGDDVLVLAVVVTGYYCSQMTHLQLLTGRTTTNLMDTNVTDITDDVFVTSVSVTELAFADPDVKLRFTCGTRTWDVSCDGAEHLLKRASDAETSATTAGTDTNLSPQSTDIVVSIPFLILLLIIMTTVIYLRRRQRPVKDVGPPEMPDLADEYGYASIKDIRGRRNPLRTCICFITNSKASQGEHAEPELG